MLETLRHYARERLEEGGVGDVWRARHAAYFADLAEAASVALYGPDELAWRRRLHADLDNLRAAVVWALDSTVETDREMALRIIGALAYEVTLDRASGIGTWAERAVPAARTSTPGRRTAVLAAAAMGFFNRGDLDEARVLVAEALQDGIAADCPAPLMGCVTSAALLVHAGEHAQALGQLQETLAHLDERDVYGRSNLLAVAANFDTLRGHHADARAQADESLRLARELGNPSQLAIALAALGFACVDSAPDVALAALEESRAVTLAGASEVQYATALSLMGVLRARAGDVVGALDALREGLVCATEVGWRGGATGVLAQVSTVLMMGTAAPPGVVIGAHVSTSGLELAAGEALMPWDEALANMRRALGDKEYEEAWALGTALSYDEAVEYAFDQMDRVSREAREG
jgi:tetratricopeptide (TPR) repeat protein